MLSGTTSSSRSLRCRGGAAGNDRDRRIGYGLRFTAGRVDLVRRWCGDIALRGVLGITGHIGNRLEPLGDAIFVELRFKALLGRSAPFLLDPVQLCEGFGGS